MPEERKLVTIIFADFVGSTSLTVSRDPEIVRATFRRTYEELRKILVGNEGTVEKFIGDAVMAVFGVPTAHDDDADRAVRAAFAMRDRVRELSSGPNAIPLELRIGINSGETVAGVGESGEFLVTGEPVNAAARLQQAAGPGEIVVGSLTHRLTRGGVAYGAVRTVDAKGIGTLEGWPAESLQSAVPEQHRGLEGLRAPLVGRDEEMQLLLAAYERLRVEARPHQVTMFGAAGAGKSRLTDEFIARIDGARVRQGRCLPYGEAITLWPIQLILRADAGIAPSDDLAAARARLRDAVSEAFPESDEVEAIERRLAVLAGLARADEAMSEIPSADLADELVWGLRRYLERRAGGEPLVLVFEDIHWAAPALLDIIEQLAESAKAPLFLLCLARPEFLDGRAGWGGGKVNAASIVLEPLTSEETRELVAKLLDIDALSESVRAAVVERAEGNPLYVEEFIRLLIETGQISKHADGRWVAMPLGELRVPPTLQGLIAARLDSAPAEVKQLLQRAAVIGRFFPTTGIAALSDGIAPDPARLRDAVRRDLIVDVDERGVGGGRMYRFKHVLVREVAYASVPKSDRATLHDRYVRWYEDALGDRRDDFIDLIAHHAEQAFLFAAEIGLPEAPDFARRAYERLRSAADRARARSDANAALALYRRALVALAAGEGTDAERIETRGYSALARHLADANAEALAELDAAVLEARSARLARLEFDLIDASVGNRLGREARKAFVLRLDELSRGMREPEPLVRTLYWRQLNNATVAEDRSLATEALRIAEESGLPDLVLRARLLLISVEINDGRFTYAHDGLAELRRQYGERSGHEIRRLLLTFELYLAMDLADDANAAHACEQLVASERDSGNPRFLAWSLGFSSACARRSGDLARARSFQEERMAILAGKVAPQQAHAHAEHARVLLALGDVPGARAHAITATEAMGSDFPGWVRLARALVHAADAEFEEADALVSQVLAIADEAGFLWPVNRLDVAQYLLERGRADDARAVLIALRARLTDPLAGRRRDEVDALLARCGVPAAGPA